MISIIAILAESGVLLPIGSILVYPALHSYSSNLGAISLNSLLILSPVNRIDFAYL